METIAIKIAGNILNELSEKIPSNLIAVNELLKNSYDAGAKEVSIKLNSANNTFEIIDNGSGMDIEGIKNLFHISFSEKIYGNKNPITNRFTQGSKGLGFLASFKFGNNVTWCTKQKDKLEYTFSVDFSQIKKSDDVSLTRITVNETNELLDHGTKITIQSDSDKIKEFELYFKKTIHKEKLLHSFLDDNFKVYLYINNKKIISNNSDIIITKICNDKQLYHITYNSDKENIVFGYNGKKFHTEKYSFDFSKFEKIKIIIDIVAFKLKGGGKKKISSLFYNPNNFQLTPLIFINDNLFNNYSIFNTNELSYTKTSMMLNQLIGFIRIETNNTSMDFNSDRTNFIENPFTDKIKSFLKKINIKIQETGSIFYQKFFKEPKSFLKPAVLSIPYDEKELASSDFKKYISDDFILKNDVKIEKTFDEVDFSFAGITYKLPITKKGERNITNVVSTTKRMPPTQNISTPNYILNHSLDPSTNSSHQYQNAKVAKIKLNCDKEINLEINSQQIDLLSYVSSIIDSNGNKVPKKKLKIFIKDKEVTNILAAKTQPEVVDIVYEYMDIITRRTCAKLRIHFIQPKRKMTKKDLMGLIILPKEYTIKFNCHVNSLIEQINSLDLKDYKDVIACSLRAIFDLCVDELKSNTEDIFGKERSNLSENVRTVVEYVNKDTRFITNMAKNTTISYNTLKNELADPDSFSCQVEKSNLGPHCATQNLTIDDIKDIAKRIRVFVMIVQEILNK